MTTFGHFAMKSLKLLCQLLLVRYEGLNESENKVIIDHQLRMKRKLTQTTLYSNISLKIQNLQNSHMYKRDIHLYKIVVVSNYFYY